MAVNFGKRIKNDDLVMDLDTSTSFAVVDNMRVMVSLH
jgi:hypothetical protein